MVGIPYLEIDHCELTAYLANKPGVSSFSRIAVAHVRNIISPVITNIAKTENDNCDYQIRIPI